MKNIISPIREITNENVIKQTFLNFLKEYNQEKSVNLTNKNFSDQQVDFAFEKLTAYFVDAFNVEVKHIKHKIKTHEFTKPESFSDFLSHNYYELLASYSSADLEDIVKFNFKKLNSEVRLEHHAIKIVRNNFQKYFVLPLIDFIDYKYISQLIQSRIFSSPIENLLDEIRNNNLILEVMNTDKPINNKIRTVYSEFNGCYYYLSYNSFVNLNSYYTHLNTVVNDFENYINKTIHVMEDHLQKMKLYNIIRLALKFALLSFSRVEKSCAASLHGPLPKNARNDTYAIFHQFINESFHDSKPVDFNPSLVDFQDLQYSITKRALEYVKTKINGLRDTQEFEERASLSVDGIPSQKLFHDKIKTNLTVPQIASLFKGLIEEKDILDVKNKTDLYRSIAACFTSKRREEFKAGTVRKNFNQPDEQTIEFLIEKLTHLLQYFKNLRDNIKG